MRPDREEMIAGARRALVEFLAPEISSIYGRSQMMYITNILQAVARESEDAVANTVAENDELRGLLREASDALSGAPETAAAMREASPPPGPLDLRLSSLRVENARLMSLLVRAQAACEDRPLDDEAAHRFWRQTVAFLRRRIERQASMPLRGG